MVKPHDSTIPDDRETRDRLLDAAQTVFLRRGTAKARTQEIANEAGVNKALLHYYFGTKANLADAVFTRETRKLFPRIVGILTSPDLPLDEKVRQVVAEQIDFHSARPYLAPYLISEMHTEPDRMQRLFGNAGPVPIDVLEAQLAKESAAGRIRPIGAQQFVASLMGLLIFPFVARPVLEVLIGLDADRFPAFIDERKRTIADFFLAGLRP